MFRSLLVLLILFMPSAYAFEAERPLPDAAGEAQAKQLFSQFRCMVCAGQSLAESDAQLAHSMRQTIRSQVKDGKTPAEIRQFMVARYGTSVTLEPPVIPATYLLWAAPFLALLLGFATIYRTAKR